VSSKKYRTLRIPATARPPKVREGHCKREIGVADFIFRASVACQFRNDGVANQPSLRHAQKNINPCASQQWRGFRRFVKSITKVILASLTSHFVHRLHVDSAMTALQISLRCGIVKKI
jgi:hypothetical protein